MSSLVALKKEMVEICRQMYQRGYLVATDGNVSVRLNEKRILITPTGVCKGFLSLKDLVTVDYGGKKLTRGPNPSSELLMHLFIHQRRKDVNAVVHAHPPFGTSFAVAGISLNEPILPEIAVFVGEVPLLAYATPSTSEVPDSLKDFVDKHQAFLLKNHGVVTLGKNLLQAYHRLERVEHLAKIYAQAKNLGKVEMLSSSDLEKLSKIKERMKI